MKSSTFLSTSNFYVAPYLPPFMIAAEPDAIRCLVVSESPLRRHTLEHYVQLSKGLHLVGSLCDGVEAYDYLQAGNEVDLVIVDLGGNGMLLDGLPPQELNPFSFSTQPRWLLIERMGNIPQFTHQPVVGRLAQPLCFGHFSSLVSQTLHPQSAPKMSPLAAAA